MGVEARLCILFMSTCILFLSDMSCASYVSFSFLSSVAFSMIFSVLSSFSLNVKDGASISSSDISQARGSSVPGILIGGKVIKSGVRDLSTVITG